MIHFVKYMDNFGYVWPFYGILGASFCTIHKWPWFQSFFSGFQSHTKFEIPTARISYSFADVEGSIISLRYSEFYFIKMIFVVNFLLSAWLFLFQCFLLAIRTLYVVVRYGLHLVDMNLEGVWENRSKYVYYTELVFELAALSIDFGHHLHMLVCKHYSR